MLRVLAIGCAVGLFGLTGIALSSSATSTHDGVSRQANAGQVQQLPEARTSTHSQSGTRSRASVQLPSGTVMKVASFDTHPHWKECFPPDCDFFVEKHGNGGLQGMHVRRRGRLDGASAMLYESGTLKTLASYPGGVRQGPVRVWDEDGRLILYAAYKDGRKDGVTCLFRDGLPSFVQQWEQGVAKNETVLVRSKNVFVPSDDAEQLAPAKQRLAAVEKEFTRDENRTKKNLTRKVAEDEKTAKKRQAEVRRELSNSIEQENLAAADKQRALEVRAQAAIVRGTHPYDPGRPVCHENRIRGEATEVGKAAVREQRTASADLTAAKKNTAAVEKSAEKQSRQIEADRKETNRRTRQWALASLEKSH